jgi:transposase
MTMKQYQNSGTINRKPRSGNPYKLTPTMLKLIEDRLQDDDETTPVQLKKMLDESQSERLSTLTR